MKWYKKDYTKWMSGLGVGASEKKITDDYFTDIRGSEDYESYLCPGCRANWWTIGERAISCNICDREIKITPFLRKHLRMRLEGSSRHSGRS